MTIDSWDLARALRLAGKARARSPFLVLVIALAVFLIVSLALCASADEAPADPLAVAAVTFQPTRAADLAHLDRLALEIRVACLRMREPLPDRNRCPALLMALTYRESSWRPAAIGARGEVGLMQVHGVAAFGYARAELLLSATNLAAGSRWLDRCALACRASGWASRSDFVERVLSRYAGIGCVPSSGARLALRWMRRLVEIEGGET